MGVIHTNISPDSIFVDTNGQCVIGEFGESIVLPTSKHLRGAKLPLREKPSSPLTSTRLLNFREALHLASSTRAWIIVLMPDDRHFGHRRKNPFWLEGNILRQGLPDG